MGRQLVTGCRYVMILIVHVCLHVFTCACVHLCACMLACIMFTYASVLACVHVCLHVCTCACVHVCVHLRMCACMCSRVHVCLHVSVCFPIPGTVQESYTSCSIQQVIRSASVVSNNHLMPGLYHS